MRPTTFCIVALRFSTKTATTHRTTKLPNKIPRRWNHSTSHLLSLSLSLSCATHLKISLNISAALVAYNRYRGRGTNPSPMNTTFRAHSSTRTRELLDLGVSARCRACSVYEYTINDDLTHPDRARPRAEGRVTLLCDDLQHSKAREDTSGTAVKERRMLSRVNERSHNQR